MVSSYPQVEQRYTAFSRCLVQVPPLEKYLAIVKVLSPHSGQQRLILLPLILKQCILHHSGEPPRHTMSVTCMPSSVVFLAT